MDRCLTYRVFSSNTSGAARAQLRPISDEFHGVEQPQPERRLALGRLRCLLFLVRLTPSVFAEWARTRRFGCPVAWHTHVVVWVCQNIVDYGVYTRLGKSRISEEIPENILNRATSPPSTAERQKPPRWTQKVVLGGERGRVGSPTNTPRD